MVVQINCKNCGAPMINHKNKCDYCGSFFYDKKDELRIIENKDGMFVKTNSNRPDSFSKLSKSGKIAIVLFALVFPIWYCKIKR